MKNMDLIKKNRFYINGMDLSFGDFNYVVTSEGKEIEYSYMCSNKNDFPPDNCGYRLVYETDDDNYRIIADPYGMNDFE